jgi:hypothetical protein
MDFLNRVTQSVKDFMFKVVNDVVFWMILVLVYSDMSVKVNGVLKSISGNETDFLVP